MYNTRGTSHTNNQRVSTANASIALNRSVIVSCECCGNKVTLRTYLNHQRKLAPPAEHKEVYHGALLKKCMLIYIIFMFQIYIYFCNVSIPEIYLIYYY